MQPIKYYTYDKMLLNIANKVKSEVSKIRDLIKPYIPETMKNKVNEQIHKLQNNLNKKETTNIKLKKIALKGYMKSYRVEVDERTAYKTFLNNNKDNVINILNNRKSPSSSKPFQSVNLLRKFLSRKKILLVEG